MKIMTKMTFIDTIQPAPRNGGFRMDDYWIWCGSVIKGDDGRYHMFASRWPKKLPFLRGYVVASEIVRAVADTPEGPYKFSEVVLPDRGESLGDGRMTHNPAIRRWGDRYALFYIGATYSGARPTTEDLINSDTASHLEIYSTIRIGLAVSSSLNGPWERTDKPILQPRSGKWDSTIVTNPAPCILGDGSALLYYRSNTPLGLRIGVAKADAFGKPFYRYYDEPVLTFGKGQFVEDPYVWQTNGRFELIAKDCRGGITGECHAGVRALSEDGVQWRLANPPKAYSRDVRWDDGQVTVQGSLERPQLLIDGDAPTHLFAATADGAGGFDVAKNTWNMVLPLSAQ